MSLHLILIGLPGAGKSTVGRLLADRLETHFTDIDPNLARATGLSIADLFVEEGEPSFRVREHRAVLEALGLPPHVIAPGGGWAAQPGNQEAAAERAFSIHLAVSPREAAVRLAGDRSRPLLVGGRPADRLATLMAERVDWYQRARAAIEVDGRSPDDLADQLAAVARREAGW